MIKHHPTSTRQVDNPNILRLIKVIGNQQLSVKEMLTAFNLTDRENFLNVYLRPAIQAGYVVPLYPDKPRHPRQKYLLNPLKQI